MPRLTLRPVERMDALDRARFQAQYLRPRRPVVLTKLAADWPALSRWTPAFWKQTYGDLEVPVFDASFAEPGARYMGRVDTMRFGAFVRRVLTEDTDLRMFLYNMPSKIPELKEDVALPTLADGFSKRFMFLFFGCRGSVTPIHYDIDMSHVFHTAIHGRKRITLFAPEESRRLNRHPFTVRSYVDVDAPDFEAFPRLADAQGWQVVLEPGETLFIPSAYWHHVHYEEGGWAISLRCTNERLRERMQGWWNLLAVSPVDRLMNKVAPRGWFRWKERRALKRALALPQHP